MYKEDRLEEFEKAKRDNRIQCSILKKLERDQNELSKDDMIEFLTNQNNGLLLKHTHKLINAAGKEK